MRWAREATQALRRAAEAAVGRRRLPGKVERSRRRPALRGWCQGRGMRMLARPRAGQIMTDGEGGAARPGWDAGWRRRSSRNSFSMGDLFQTDVTNSALRMLRRFRPVQSPLWPCHRWDLRNPPLGNESPLRTV